MLINCPRISNQNFEYQSRPPIPRGDTAQPSFPRGLVTNGYNIHEPRIEVLFFKKTNVGKTQKWYRVWPNWARKAAVAGRWCDGRRLYAVKFHQVVRSCGFSGACLQICDCGGLKSVFFASYTITTMQQQVCVGFHTLDSWRSRQS